MDREQRQKLWLLGKADLSKGVGSAAVRVTLGGALFCRLRWESMPGTQRKKLVQAGRQTALT